MELKLQPSQKQIDDLRLLCTSPGLNEVAERVATTSATVLSPADAKKEFEALAVNLTAELQASLFRQVMGLRAVMLRGDFTSEDLMVALGDSLRQNKDFSADLDSWETNVREPFHKILDSRFIRIVSKSANLAYDYAYLLRTARIITDARPVFSEYDGVVDGIDGIVVSHVLRLEFENSDNKQTMSIVLDHLDVKMLRDACDRALQKAELAERRFTESDIPTKVTGKEDS